MNSTKKQNKNNKNYFLFDFVKITGALPTLLYMRVKTITYGKVKPSELKKGYLITSNHISFFDPIIIACVFWKRRIHFLATKELFSSRAKDFFFTQMHCIKVDKDNFSLNSFHEVRDTLKRDKLVIIFPEGQVNHNGEKILGFKSGAVLMAHQSNKPIVPICIIKREKWFKRQVVLIGDPIDVRDICGNMPSMDNIVKVSELLHDKETELMQRYLNSIGDN